MKRADQVAAKLADALISWYRIDRTGCAHWCDTTGDPSGALLGRVRESLVPAHAEQAPERVALRIVELTE